MRYRSIAYWTVEAGSGLAAPARDFANYADALRRRLVPCARRVRAARFAAA
jgi:hypothetical protein